MKKINFERPLLFLCIVSLSFIFASCTRKSSTPADTVVVGLSSAPATLDPRFSTDANGMRIDGLIFSSLVKVGPKLDVVPDAAAKWSYKDKTYTFELVPNLKFQNGRDVTKEDLEYTFEQFESKKSPFSSDFQIIDHINIKKDDDHFVITIRLKKFSAKFLGSDLPVIKILPKKEIEAAGDSFTKHPIGTGPFKFVSSSDNDILLQKADNPTFHPKIDKILFKVIRDDFTRYQKIVKGEVDLIQSDLPLDKVKKIEKEDANVRVYKYPGLSMSYILVNLKDPMLKNIDLRKAISEGLNRPQIIQYKLNGLAAEATSILTPNNAFFNKDLKNPAYDPKAAKAEVQKEGLLGKQLSLKTSNNPVAIDNGQVLANQLSQIGLKVHLESFEWGTFYDDIKKGNFQLATMKWVGAFDPDIYRLAFDSKELPPGRNRGSYVNKELDKLVENALVTESDAKRKEMYMKVQKMVFDDYAIIPLWYEQQVAVVSKKIEGYSPWEIGNFSPLLFVTKKAQ